MFETSYLEIDSHIYKKNLSFIQNHVASPSDLCLIIKGNAYGHGAREILQLAIQLGQKNFAVFHSSEAWKIFEYLASNTRLIIMGPMDLPEMEWAIENELEFYVHTKESLARAIKLSKKINNKAKVHLEMETGMNRLGLEVHECQEISEIINHNKHFLELTGICTHFAGAENIINFPRVKNQIRVFEEITSYFSKNSSSSFMKHAACSAAALRFPETKYDLVRIGILQYGYWPSQETLVSYGLTRGQDMAKSLEGILSWKSKVMAIKEIPKGSFVGYGSSFATDKSQKMAVIPVGYSEGFTRNLSNYGHVLIRGERAPVAGIVNMNAITVEVTDISDIQVGDEVTLIGKQKENTIGVASFSEYNNQLNYELITRLPQDIPRLVK